MSLQLAWELFIKNWPMFLRGAYRTLLVSMIGTIIGALIGLVVGIIRTIPMPKSKVKKSTLKIVNKLLSAYIEFFRGTPMMVQAMVIYYGVAGAYGIQLNRMFAGILIVSINTGAYMAEIIRGGVLSIDDGQFEAAQALGMTHVQTMINVVLPQVIRNILPATGNEFVVNIKDTSVLSVISITELFYQTKTIASSSFKFFEPFFITCIIYFIMTYTVTRLLRLFEKKLEGPDNYSMVGYGIPTDEADEIDDN